MGVSTTPQDTEFLRCQRKSIPSSGEFKQRMNGRPDADRLLSGNLGKKGTHTFFAAQEESENVCVPFSHGSRSRASAFDRAALGAPAQHAAGQIGKFLKTFLLQHNHRLRRARA